jgi:hypothetical protein
MDALRRDGNAGCEPMARRRLALALGLGLMLALAAASVSFADSSDPPVNPPVSLPPPTAPTDQQGESGNGSRSGYPDASEQHAENLLLDDFSSTIHSLARDPVDLSGQDPTYLNDHTAVVSPAVTGDASTEDQIEGILNRDQDDVQAITDDLNALQQQAEGSPGDPPQLISSSTPLRVIDDSGQKAPVDLSLEQQGSTFVAQNPVVDLSLPDDLNHDVTIGDQGLKVDVGASQTTSADPIDGGENLFYADAKRATDVVLAPTTTGLETMYELRAPDSPDQLRMTYSLPEGASLETAPQGGARVVKDGTTIAAVLPPSAQDASGTALPLKSSVDGDSLVIDIAHSDPSIAYPILVDPAIILNYNWNSGNTQWMSDWTRFGNPYSPVFSWAADCHNGCGLWVDAPANLYNANNYAGWYYLTPNASSGSSYDAYVSSLTMGPLAFAGATAGSGTNTPEFWAGVYGQGYNELYVPSSAFFNWSPNLPTKTTEIVFGLSNASNFTWTGVAHTAYFGGAAIGLDDATRPDFASGEPNLSGTDSFNGNAFQLSPLKASDGTNVPNWSVSNWVDNASGNVNLAATDKGLGITGFHAPSSTAGQQAWIGENCFGINASPCPLNPPATSASFTTSSWPNGANYTSVDANDPTGKFDWRGWEIRVDHWPPDIETSGSLIRPAGPGPYTLHVDAVDGDATDGASPTDPDAVDETGTDWESGVKRITVKVNNQLVADSGVHDCTAEAGSCPLSLNYTLNPNDFSTNALHFEVTATDELGHSQTHAWDTTITGAAPSAKPDLSVSGPLFTAPAGWVGPQSSSVDAQAQDAAGVTELDLYMDGSPIGQATQSCSAGSCSLSHTFSVDMSSYAAGAHTARVAATDAAGQTQDESWAVNVDPTGSISSGAAQATLDAAAPSVLEGVASGSIDGGQSMSPRLAAPNTGQMAINDNQSGGTVAVSPSGGFTINDPTASATVSPVGTSGGASSASLVSNSAGVDASAVYANTYPSVDTAVSPDLIGVHTYELIRAPIDGSSIRWDVSLPASEQLNADPDDGGIEIVKPTTDVEPDGTSVSSVTSVGTISDPVVTDATGASVPASLSLSGSRVTLNLAGTMSSYAYPLVADVEWASTNALNNGPAQTTSDETDPDSAPQPFQAFGGVYGQCEIRADRARKSYVKAHRIVSKGRNRCWDAPPDSFVMSELVQACVQKGVHVQGTTQIVWASKRCRAGARDADIEHTAAGTIKRKAHFDCPGGYDDYWRTYVLGQVYLEGTQYPHGQAYAKDGHSHRRILHC